MCDVSASSVMQVLRLKLSAIFILPVLQCRDPVHVWFYYFIIVMASYNCETPRGHENGRILGLDEKVIAKSARNINVLSIY